jgi:hypothetical protein
VNFEELDVALEELETRLERLRALYEQYFLGFEKIEPAVARKDVDRRIYLLRREKIRNTGKRFKLQTIIQRYNTFQQYWQRICREIENGTYKRHLARAERILGPDQMLTIAARRRFGRAAAERLAAEAEPEARDDASPLDDIEAEPGELAAMSQSLRGIERRRSPSSDAAPEVHADRAPLPPIPRAPVPSRLPIPGTVPPNAQQRAARPSKFESLSLDMDFDSWDPETSVRARNRGSLPKEEPAPPPPKEPFLPAKSAPNSAPPPAPPTAPSEPFARAKSAPNAAPPPPPRREPRASPAPNPASPPRAIPPPKPERVAAKPVPLPVPSAAPKAAPAAAKPAPAAAKPAPAERPTGAPIAKIAPVEKRVPAAASKTSTLSDERIRELHENLVRMKRENKEAGQVSVESLAKTLRATEEKLRAEHKNRRIEFDVVLRDGKAVVKPKVR